MEMPSEEILTRANLTVLERDLLETKVAYLQEYPAMTKSELLIILARKRNKYVNSKGNLYRIKSEDARRDLEKIQLKLKMAEEGINVPDGFKKKSPTILVVPQEILDPFIIRYRNGEGRRGLAAELRSLGHRISNTSFYDRARDFSKESQCKPVGKVKEDRSVSVKPKVVNVKLGITSAEVEEFYKTLPSSWNVKK